MKEQDSCAARRGLAPWVVLASHEKDVRWDSEHGHTDFRDDVTRRHWRRCDQSTEGCKR